MTSKQELAGKVAAGASPTRRRRDLNSNVYGRIGLSECKRRQLVDLLAELRASGNEFDVERSTEVIDELVSRHARAAVAHR